MNIESFKEGVKNLDFTPFVDSKVLTGLAALGTYFIAKKAWSPIYSLWKHALRPRKDLKGRYGGTWAVVTGASDGIGEAICH